MSDFNSIKTQIQSLIDSANATTGNTDTNLTDGVNALIGGYGQGGYDNEIARLFYNGDTTTIYTVGECVVGNSIHLCIGGECITGLYETIEN